MGDRHGGGMLLEEVMRRGQVCVVDSCQSVFRLDALALSVIATATWLAGWVGGCLSQPVLYQND